MRTLYPARLHVNTTEKQKEKVKALADKNSVNYSVIVREAIEFYLKHHSETRDDDCH